METHFPPRGGSPVEAWQLNSGDLIRAQQDDGTTITARVTGIDRGKPLPPGDEDVIWEGTYPRTGHLDLDLPHGHRVMHPHDKVTRVWATSLVVAA
jgi:hypothetical protein